MASASAIIAAVKKTIEVGSILLDAGKDLTPIATELFNVIGKSVDDISDADLDRLAAATDAAHAEVQEPIPDEGA